MKKQILVTFTTLLLASVVFGQAIDSLKLKDLKTNYTSLKILDQYPDSFTRIDTNLNFLHQYNQAEKFEVFGHSLGNLGSPFFNLVFDPKLTTGFRLGLDHFDYIKFKPDEVLFYDSYTPFFDFSYAQGNREMQFFSSKITRNINPFWNLSVQYNSNNSQGIYFVPNNNHQQSKTKNVAITSHFSSPDTRYKIFASYILNRYFVRENGGITDDSSFWDTSGTARTISVRRSGATFQLDNAKQTLLEGRFNIYQEFKPFKPLLDTNNKVIDTNSFRNKIRLVHKLDYTRNRYKFEDPFLDSSYYENYFLNSESTNDTLGFYQLSNALFLKLNSKDNNGFRFLGGIQLDNGKVHDVSSDLNFSNFHVLGDVKINFPKFDFIANADLILAGIHSGNYHLASKAGIKSGRDAKLAIGFNSGKYSQAYMLMKLHSNHVSWDNNFNDLFLNKIYAQLLLPGLNSKIEASGSLINNYAYFDENINPTIISNTITHYSLSFVNKLNLGKFHFFNNLVVQNTDAIEAMAIAPIMLNNTSFFEDKVFKKKMLLQVGFDVRLRNNYYAPGYFAPYSIFYMQNEIENQLYPFVDVFLNARVEKMKIFVKVEHVNDGFPVERYYASPYYPLNPRVIKLGFSWMFFD